MFQDLTTVTAYIQNLTRQHEGKGIHFSVAKNLPYVILKLANGTSALISLYGGQVMNWIDTKGRDVFFTNEQSVHSEGKPIRGGAPIYFSSHQEVDRRSEAAGFTQTSFWNFKSCESDEVHSSVTLELTDSESTRREWPHAFRFEVTYTIREFLEMRIKLENTSKVSFSSQFAFQNYFNTQSIHNVQVRGVERCEFIDQARSGLNRGLEKSQSLKFAGLVDRVYKSVIQPITIHGIGNYVLTIESDMPDRIVWNPGRISSSKFEDVPPMNFEKFVCVAAGAIAPPICLPSGGTWMATQKIVISK